ncbi:MAG TPA: hypothetical protein VGR27_08540 [Longimicrobiaceae bacterium]|nr:hypothetical protein [Longimicrobiaceae bacterium]
MKVTAFVSHPDCALHDTGWKHPEHQGRLPALVRAVYRDMLTLHDRLLEVEARPATEEDLLLVHSPAYVASVREAVARAAAAGEPLTLGGETRVSAASWAAALAAAGTAITGVEVVLAGEVRNAFCAARPPGEGALPEQPGRFSLFNNLAIAAHWLRVQRHLMRMLIVRWGGGPDDALTQLFAGDAGVRVLAVHQQSAAGRESAASPLAGPGIHSVSLPAGTGGGLFTSAFEAALDETLAGFTPELILLAAGFDALSADPLGELVLEPVDFYTLTRHLRERADALCGGRLVSVLEGGYSPAALGQAVVQHLRALSGLPAASPTT